MPRLSSIAQPLNVLIMYSFSTAQFTPTDTSDLQITGGPYGSDTYQLAQFHFHWGCSDLEGSEHTINGRRYLLAMASCNLPLGSLKIVSLSKVLTKL